MGAFPFTVPARMALRLPGRLLGRGSWTHSTNSLGFSVRAGFATAAPSSLDRFLSTMDEYQPVQSASRNVRKSHVDVPAQFVRFKSPASKISAKTRKQLKEQYELLGEQIAASSESDRAGTREITDQITKLGEDHGHN